MLPLIIAGAGLAGAGMIGSYASGAMSKGRQPDQDAYKYRYKPEFDWSKADQGLAHQETAQGRFGSVYDQAMLEASGQAGPSIAQQQQALGQQRVADEAAQFAASARGGPAAVAAAQRQAQIAQANSQAQTAQATGILRAQERQAALGLGLEANRGAAGNAASMRGMSQAEEQARVGADMQAERFRQEGAMAYDQAAVGADQAHRAKQRQFWGQLTSMGGSMGSMGASSMMGGGAGGGGGGGGVSPQQWNDAWSQGGGDPRYA